MSPGQKSKLGTTSQLAQCGAAAAAKPVATTPDEMVLGTEVWLHFRRWRKGRISRVITINPKQQRQGIARGNRAVVELAHDGRGDVNHRLTVRRPLAELVPAVAPEPHAVKDRDAAR